MPQNPAQKALLTILVSIAISVLVLLVTVQIFADPDLKPSNFLGFGNSSSSQSSSNSPENQNSSSSTQSSPSSSTQTNSSSNSNNPQGSSSTSSTSNSSSTQSQSSSSSQSVATKTMQTYANQYFPDLKLVYPEDWKMETKTAPVDIYLNLVQRTVTLTKNQSKLTFYISPIMIPSGCGGPDTSPYVSKTGNFYRYRVEPNNYYYSEDETGGDCAPLMGNLLYSNIKVTDIQPNPKSNLTKQQITQAYQSNAFKSQFAIYNYSLYLTSSNPSEIQEADQIVANSVFK